MDWNIPAQVAAFFDLHSDNPREGPGDFQSAARAFAAAKDALQADPANILDLACGPGMQTRHLSELAPEANILGLDITKTFIKRLNDWCDKEGLSDRVSGVVGDMSAPPVAAHTQDLIWCEGAVYMLGVQAALAAWRDLLRPRGCIAFTEPVFLKTPLPKQVVDNWAEYPPMTDVAGVEQRLQATDFRLVDSFVLPDNAWAEYYEPLQKRVNVLREKYAADAHGALVIEEGQSEIDAWRNFGEYFSYAFFVVQR